MNTGIWRTPNTSPEIVPSSWQNWQSRVTTAKLIGLISSKLARLNFGFHLSISDHFRNAWRTHLPVLSSSAAVLTS